MLISWFAMLSLVTAVYPQNSGADHATFICYAPYEDPQIAIAVIVANGVQGKFPQNVARDAMKAYFKL